MIWFCIVTLIRKKYIIFKYLSLHNVSLNANTFIQDSRQSIFLRISFLQMKQLIKDKSQRKQFTSHKLLNSQSFRSSSPKLQTKGYLSQHTNHSPQADFYHIYQQQIARYKSLVPKPLLLADHSNIIMLSTQFIDILLAEIERSHSNPQSQSQNLQFNKLELEQQICDLKNKYDLLDNTCNNQFVQFNQQIKLNQEFISHQKQALFQLNQECNSLKQELLTKTLFIEQQAKIIEQQTLKNLKIDQDQKLQLLLSEQNEKLDFCQQVNDLLRSQIKKLQLNQTTRSPSPKPYQNLNDSIGRSKSNEKKQSQSQITYLKAQMGVLEERESNYKKALELKQQEFTQKQQLLQNQVQTLQKQLKKNKSQDTTSVKGEKKQIEQQSLKDTKGKGPISKNSNEHKDEEKLNTLLIKQKDLQISQLVESVRDSQSENQRLAKEIVRLQQSQGKDDHQKSEKSSTIVKLNDALSQMFKEKLELQNEQKTFVSQNKQLTLEIQSQGLKIKELQGQQQKSGNQNKSLSDEIQKQEVSSQKQKSKVVELEQEQSKLTLQNGILTQELRQMEIQNQQLNSKINELILQLHNSEQEIGLLNNKLKHFEEFEKNKKSSSKLTEQQKNLIIDQNVQRLEKNLSMNESVHIFSDESEILTANLKNQQIQNELGIVSEEITENLIGKLNNLSDYLSDLDQLMANL